MKEKWIKRAHLKLELKSHHFLTLYINLYDTLTLYINASSIFFFIFSQRYANLKYNLQFYNYRLYYNFDSLSLLNI